MGAIASVVKKKVKLGDGDRDESVEEADVSTRVGDQVVIKITDVDVLRHMQIDHGGWTDSMQECLVGPCELLQFTDVYAVVKAPSGIEHRLNPDLLSKYDNLSESILQTVGQSADSLGESRLASSDGSRRTSGSTIYVGLRVTLTTDAVWMKSLQARHGGWSNIMTLLLGQEVEVTEVFIDGDLTVTWCGTYWVINPQCIGEPKREPLKKGDRVLISSDIEATKAWQESHGGWTEKMKEFAGQAGKVEHVDMVYDVLVEIGHHSIWYNPLVLTKISDVEYLSRYSVGDMVKVIDDETRVKDLQEGHGEWKDFMNLILKKKGMVKSIHPNGDLQVEIKGIEMRLNPHCVVKVELDKGDSFSTEMKKIMSMKLDDETANHSGDTRLHVAVRNKNCRLCCQLVDDGADVNAQNEKGMTPIMLAVYLGYDEVLTRLIQHPDVNLNIGDIYCNTALHLAVMKSNQNVVRILLEAGADIKAVNNKKFTPFHLAAGRGPEKILGLFLDKHGGSLVDLQKDDMFAALHLAAINNNSAGLRLLIEHKADLNIRNSKMQTALHIAVSQKYMDCVKILVESEAEVNLRDNDGDTPLHDAIRLNKKDKMKESMNAKFGLGGMFNFMDSMLKVMGGIDEGSDKSADIAIYLVQHGADLHIQNSAGKSPLTKCKDQSLLETLRNIQAEERQTASCTGRETPSLVPESALTGENTAQLQITIQNLQDEILCTICRENRANIAFNCGHRACDACDSNLHDCHMCRARIETRIRIY